MKLIEFNPDIIVEVTNACNRSCRGCYAPNVVIGNAGARSSGISNLEVQNLSHNWPTDDILEAVSIRGGEPTLNPNLPEILDFLSKRAKSVFLETNGDWIGISSELVRVVREFNITVKLSVDSMHGSSATKIAQQLSILNGEGILTLVAITEFSDEDFAKSLSLVPVEYRHLVIRQIKAREIEELIVPKLGIINVYGTQKKSVTSKFKPSLKAAWMLPFTLFLMTFPSSSNANSLHRVVSIGLAANFSTMSDSTSNPYVNYFRNAVDLAISEHESDFKKRNISIETREFDYGDDKNKVISSANEAVASNVLAVMGYVYSSDALLAGPVLNSKRLLLVTPTATADRVEEIGPYVRRTCFSDAYQAEAIAAFAYNTKHIKRVAVVSVADCAYCQSLRVSFRKKFESLGGAVSVDKTILENDDNFVEIGKSLKAENIDAVFIPNYERVSGNLIANLYDAGIRPKYWLGGDGWGNSPGLFNRIVGKRKIEAYSVSHWYHTSKSNLSKKFVSAYLAKYNRMPLDTAVLAYDATNLLIKAILSTEDLSRSGLLAAVEKIERFEGVTGSIRYTRGSRTPVKPAVILRINNGVQNFEKVVYE